VLQRFDTVVRLLVVILVIGAMIYGSRLWRPICGVGEEELVEYIATKSFDYFCEERDKSTDLILDSSRSREASIAATGFGLGALVVGAEEGWIDHDTAQERALRVLDFLTDTNESGMVEPTKSVRGFFFHFLDVQSAERASHSELSIIDTAILVYGALTAGEYFGGSVQERAEALYTAIEWDWFMDEKTGCFFGAWVPEQGFLDWQWNYYSDEVILMTLLAIASPTHPVPVEAFYSWERELGAYEGWTIIQSWHGGAFTYQYAHIWLDLRNKVDRDGIDWWKNSRDALLANRQFCIDNATKYESYGEDSWGLTACLGPSGYDGDYGALPRGDRKINNDGTVSPAAAIGSIVFTPDESLSALSHFCGLRKLWGPYGLRGSFNAQSGWYSPTYFGIEEGITLLMLANLHSGLIWQYCMKSRYIQQAMQLTGFRNVPEVR